MKRLLTVCLLLLAACSEENHNSVLATRGRTPLEKTIEGIWAWSEALSRDTVEFRDDLTFEGVKDSATYAGTFVLENDSLLKMTRTVNMHGSPMSESYEYKVLQLNNLYLRLSSGNRNLIYSRL